MKRWREDFKYNKGKSNAFAHVFDSEDDDSSSEKKSDVKLTSSMQAQGKIEVEMEAEAAASVMSSPMPTGGTRGNSVAEEEQDHQPMQTINVLLGKPHQTNHSRRSSSPTKSKPPMKL